MTLSGPAGPPAGAGALPTRREARALREAAALASAAAVADSAVTDASVIEASIVTPDAVASTPATVDSVAVDAIVLEPVALESLGHEPAVPVPPVAIVSVSPDLAVVVDSTTVPPRGPRLRQARPRSLAPAPTAPAGSRPVSSRRPGGRRKPIAKIVTLLAIPAIFLTAALPAYAFSPQGGAAALTARASGESQAVTVTAAAAAVSIATDGFSATSQAELDDIEAGLQADLAQQAAAEAARSSAAQFATYGIRAEGDDYPWPSAGTESQGGGLSPLGYYYRECVDFVAWRLNRDAGATGSPWRWTWSSMTPGGGNASAWASGWEAKGWPASKAPIVGAVAWFTYNHVAYVQSVPGDGTVVLEEYNWNGSHAYHTRTVPISEVPVYLYPPS